MNQVNLPIEWVWAILTAIVGLVFWLIPSPSKLVESSNRKVEELRKDHNSLAEKHNALERQHIESNTRLGTELRGVLVELRELRVAIKELTRQMDQRHDRRN